ncbi:MAG TPA: c-type cytochrome domain-containing protein [Anaerolineae bacterium]
MSKTKTSPSPKRSIDVRKAGAATSGCVIILLGLFLIGFVLAVITIGLNLMGVLGNQAVIAGSGEAVDQTGLERRESAEARLSSYGWVDEAAGLVRIPVEQAMVEIATTGLPVGTAGLETPTPEIPTPTPTTEPQVVEAEPPAEGTTIAEESPATPTPEASPTPMVDLANVSFQNHVLPIFEERCTQCHGGERPEGGQRIEEGLILLSYDDILNGSWNGSVIEPGNVEDSYLIEQIVTGRMPKEGERVPPDQIEIIEAWVAAGAPNN